MADNGPSTNTPRSFVTIAMIVVLLLQLGGILGPFAYEAVTRGETTLSAFVIVFALATALTIAGLWLRRPWAPWSAFVVVAGSATIDLFLWSARNQRLLAIVGGLLLAALVVLVFRAAIPPVARISAWQRALYGCVLAFAAWVAVWGLFFPAQIGSRLPLTAPPLHARFLGAMYLSGAVFMLLAMLSRRWHEARVVTMILAIWTGTLGLVSVINLSAFDWSRGPLWLWFVAYIGFPLTALWIVWCQRAETAHPAEPVLSPALRGFLYAQGLVASLLGLWLLLAPAAMTAVWPWSIQPLLAHIYGAPFLAFGVGSLYAARQHGWSEVRIVVAGTLVFALGVLIGSLLHSNLFDLRSLSAWLWFGGFGIAAGALAAFVLWRPLRVRSAG